MKKVAILGSTGSIGTQALQVAGQHSDKFEVLSLVAYSNGELLTAQAAKFHPKYTALVSRDGEECLTQAVKECDIALVATRGIVALDAVMYCVAHDIDVAIANKETLVTAGALINDALCSSKSRLLPVDSEHSAIFQCLQGHVRPKKLILTASGGALYGKSVEQLRNCTAADALAHPNWNMGSKITIDSATLMNKTFEVIEASWLFDMPVTGIDILVHRQSIVHSLVQFTDGSVIAQLSNPDMRLAIQYALGYPERYETQVPQLGLADVPPLTFERVDAEKFPAAKLAYLLADAHPLMPTVLNAANDVCVEAFLCGKIGFLDIYDTVSFVLSVYSNYNFCAISVAEIKRIDKIVREFTYNYLNGENNGPSLN
jgi:1-deoxy-D-xylulose-5-phosphate reductoisomerase